MNRWPPKRLLTTALAAGVLIGLLLIPDPTPLPEGAGQAPFLWDRDDLWTSLETRFSQARAAGCESLQAEIDAHLDTLLARIEDLGSPAPSAGDPRLSELEAQLFDLAPLVGACTERVPDFVALTTRLRAAVKDASRHWDLAQRMSRDRLYRLLYGSRAAVEEVLLQRPLEGSMPTVTLGTDEPSATPSAEHYGVRVHSGDILVSRGGAPTSALIARGNDYPGNFSHIALLHIDETSGEATIVEAHIEVGVVLSSLDDYLGDTKLRVMVLRPRADLPALAADPMLPHRAASTALEEVRKRRIAYDFAMDYKDPEKQFCSEVASSFYGVLGIDLWQGLTSMSSRGVTGWLSALGVRHFETHGPSDLEYDPKLRVVAEWRDPDTLFKDHVDNAVVDVLLEGAEGGEELEYSWSMLPAARLTKAYSVALNLVGRAGPVPQGMSATIALRVRWLGQRHAAVKERTLALVGDFAAREGYTAPYWELVALARRAKAEIDGH